MSIGNGGMSEKIETDLDLNEDLEAGELDSSDGNEPYDGEPHRQKTLEKDFEKEFKALKNIEEVEDTIDLDLIENILDLEETEYPRFTLAKNKARFLRMVSWYRTKEEWIEVAPLSGVTKLFKQQTKELEGIRSSKLDYEMELETGTLTPSQRSYRKDELKMCRVQEKMAVHLISKLQVKIKSGRR